MIRNSEALEQASALIPDSIVEDDHGRFQVGLHDEAGSFPTRRFASAVAAREEEVARAEW
jgi:hypothetical protein